MPPKVQKEALVLVINIGSTSHNKEIDPLMLEKAKQIARQKIEKMIFLKPKDEVAIILMGSSITKNTLKIEHVEEFADFQLPNWDLIEKVIDLQPTNHCSNWVEVLEITLQFMKHNVIDAATRKVILMSDFEEEEDIITQFQADAIADEVSEERIDLITISDKSLNESPASLLTLSEQLLKEVHEKINGLHLSFDSALSSLKFYIDTPTKLYPCYYTLELVDKKIPIVSHIKTDEKKFPAWKKAKGGRKVESKTQYLDKHRNTYEKEEIVRGYKYGGTFIPVEKDLEETLSYKSGPKSYRIYSFTHKRNMNLEYLYDSNAAVILPSSSAENVTKPFYSLVQALYKADFVAIARKVCRTNCAPRMVALFPCIDIPDEPWCLVELALAFAEDRRIADMRSMKSVMKLLTSEQNEAVNSLIDSLLLPETQDSIEVDGAQYFLPGCVPDPAVQHRWHMLSYRAVNPDKPLPPMENYLKEILEAPLIKERSTTVSENIKKLFQLESTDLKDKKHKAEEENNMNVDIRDTDVKDTSKLDDKFDAGNASYKDYAESLDTSDIDLDELAAKI